MFRFINSTKFTNRLMASFITILVASLSLYGCGDNEDQGDNNKQSTNNNNEDANKCEAGEGQCYGAEMCVNSLCSPIAGQSFSLTIERAEMAEAGKFLVNVRAGGRGFIWTTGTTATTAQPQWYEANTWDIKAASDYWALTLLKRSGNVDTEIVMTCELAFKSALFEQKNELLCEDGPNKFWYSIELQKTPE